MLGFVIGLTLLCLLIGLYLTGFLFVMIGWIIEKVMGWFK